MLFNNRNTRNKRKSPSHLHYGTAAKARQTLKYLRKRPKGEQRKGAQTMYLRAKFHAHQTQNMREAMKIYADFLQKIK